MPAHPQNDTPAIEDAHGRRTAIALVCAALISLTMLALLAIFDVK